MHPFPARRYNIGDVLTYTRNADGSTVTGTVIEVYERGTLESLSPAGITVFAATQLQQEQVAYRLELTPEDADRVGHPVTLGHSRVVRSRRHTQ